MNVRELKAELEKFDDYDIVVIGDFSEGWSNIEELTQNGSSVEIKPEEYPVFSDN